jgi:hypothetical protein
MQIRAVYSHLNGEEFLLVHRRDLWDEIQEVIDEIDAEACKTKRSRERTMSGRILYSPIDMNNAFKRGLQARGWTERRNTFWVAPDERLMRGIYSLPGERQRELIQEAGHDPIMSYNQTDYLKDRVAVEVQFGKYAFVAHDLFVKHLSFYVSEIIDVGIEILPMKELEKEMSSGVPYFERDLMNVVRQGRGVPAVPLVMVGVAP